MTTFAAGFKLPTAEAIENLHRIGDGDEPLSLEELTAAVRSAAEIAAHNADNFETLLNLFRDYLEATGREPNLKAS